MNNVILMGRLTRDPEIRNSQNTESAISIVRYTLAVDRPFRSNNDENTADFINCVGFGKDAEFAEKYLHKGIKILVTGHIQTGSYTNKDGVRVYTTDVIIERQEFAESKNAGSGQEGSRRAENARPESASVGDGFMNIPDGIDEELPFN